MFCNPFVYPPYPNVSINNFVVLPGFILGNFCFIYCIFVEALIPLLYLQQPLYTISSHIYLFISFPTVSNYPTFNLVNANRSMPVALWL